MASACLAGLELGSIYPCARALIFAADNTVLATYQLGLPAFPPASAPDVAANPVANVLASNSGDADHFWLADKDGVPRIFGRIGVSGSGADMEVAEDPLRPGNVTPLISGQPTSLGNLVYRAPP